MDQKITQPLPDDLDAYLRDSESRYSDITANTEKCIVWADSDNKAKTENAIIYLHGFSATRQETRPLADLIAKRFNANLFYTRLTGHGRPNDALLEGDLQDWQQDALEAWAIGQRLGKRIIIIGNSTGATLATWLANKIDQTQLSAMILLSPNFGINDPLAPLLAWPLGGKIAELVVGKYRSWETQSEEHARYWTSKYPSRSLVPMMKLVNEIKKIDKSTLRQPLQMIYSPKDQVIKPLEIDKMFQCFGSPNKQLIPFVESEHSSQHILAGDILSPKTTETLVEMISQFLHNNLSK